MLSKVLSTTKIIFKEAITSTAVFELSIPFSQFNFKAMYDFVFFPAAKTSEGFLTPIQSLIFSDSVMSWTLIGKVIQTPEIKHEASYQLTVTVVPTPPSPTAGVNVGVIVGVSGSGLILCEFLYCN